jgi:parallel beta-helix repeat protein
MAKQKTAGVLVLAVLRPLADEMDQRARRRVIDLLMPAQMSRRRLRDNNGGNMTVIEKARVGMIAVAAVMLVSVARRLMGARRLSSGMMALVVAGIVLLVAVGGASAADCGAGTAKPVCECGDTVTGDFTFTADLTCTNHAQNGLIIGADDITIDGAGFKITGNREDLSCGGEESVPAAHSGIVNTGYGNVVIKNLEIENFCTGIALDGWPPVVDNNTVTDCKIHDCGNSTARTHGIHIVGANNCTIVKNEIYNIDGDGIESGCGGGGNGIFMYGVNADRGNYNNITCNNLYDNIKSGFLMKMMCMHNTISSNTATGNGEGGIVLMCKKSNYNIIEGNNASENVYDGIYIGGRNNTLINNSVFNNGYIGINMQRNDGSYNNELHENTVCGNGYTDISTCGHSCYGNHGDNNTCDSTSYYDDEGTTGCAYDCEYEVGCVAEDGTVFGCGDTVTKNCTFNGEMDCSTTRYGLIIGADNITIDGAGYALERTDPGECTLCPSAGVLNKGYDDITITNLEIKHFCNGIYLNIDYDEGEGVVYRNIIENCDIHHNGNATSPSATHGIKMRYVFNSTIRNNSIHDQIAYVDPNPGCEDGGNGLFLYIGDYNNITGNRFYDNQKAGMLIKMKPRYWNISHNHLWGNGQGGIILRCKLCDFNTIEHNNASDNYGSGIFIGGNDNTIRYNTVCNNRDGGPYYDDSVGGHGYGINIGRGDGSLNNTLISNTVCGNDYLDIRVVTGVTGNTGDENTCNTTYNYNDGGTTGCTYSCSTQQPLGDLNGDDKITPADAVIALQMAVRGEYSEDADVNGDRRVTSLDALMILQTAAEL